MKAIHKSTAKWAEPAAAEIARQGLPFPPQFLLAIIDVESTGVPGLINPKSGASGLMQVMPIALESYNHAHAVKYSMADMRDKQNGIAQIRVGAWLAGQFWRNAYSYLSKRLAQVPIDQIAKIADLMYAAGPSFMRKHLEKLPTPTFEAFEAAYPKSNALPHPRRVFDRVAIESFSADAVNKWLSTSARSSITVESEKKNWMTAAILSAVVGWIVHLVLSGIRSER